MIRLLSLLILLTSLSAQALTINVPEEVESIQGGINISEDGDIILVQPGTYTENLTFTSRNVTVASLMLTTGDEAYIDSTIINGRRGTNVVFFRDYVDDAEIIGFTLTGGDGSGVYLTNNCDPVISYCNITGNSSAQGGGIFMLNDCDPIIRNCNIISNSGNIGGGINVWNNCTPLFEDCVISGNSAQDGGGMHLRESRATFINCVITDNIAQQDGGGINCRQSFPSFVNCTIADNFAHGIAHGLYIWGFSDVIVNSSILWGNDGEEVYFGYWDRNLIDVTYSVIEGGENGIQGIRNDEIVWGEGNIEENPMFVDAENGDHSLSEDSPCIDTGDPALEVDPDYTRSDMGALFYPLQNIEVRPDILVFDEFEPEDSLVIVIHNVGLQTLDVSGQVITPNGTPFSVSGGSSEFQIEPGESHPIWILLELADGEEFPIGRTYCQISSNDRDQGQLLVELTDQFQSAPYDADKLPIEFRVHSVYPNPFNSTATISFDVQREQLVSVAIYDIAGRIVTTLANDRFSEGKHALIWDAGNLSDGVYFARVTADQSLSKTVKMVLVK